VGTALHRNPFPIVVPCHRVLKDGGAIGGFACGVAMKKRLLALEAGQRAIPFPEGGA
jgi:O-6-methylguanine DNA methyltransferase